MNGLDELEAKFSIDLGVDGVTTLEIAWTAFHVALKGDKCRELVRGFFLGLTMTYLNCPAF